MKRNLIFFILAAALAVLSLTATVIFSLKIMYIPLIISLILAIGSIIALPLIYHKYKTEK